MKRIFRRKKNKGTIKDNPGIRDPSTSARSSLYEPSTAAGEPPANVDGGSPSQITPDLDNKALPNSVDTYNVIIDCLEQGFSLVRDVSEATPVLSPLKSASSLLVRALKALRARLLTASDPN